MDRKLDIKQKFEALEELKRRIELWNKGEISDEDMVVDLAETLSVFDPTLNILGGY